MRRSNSILAFLAIALASCPVAAVQAADPFLESRPCGPDSMTGAMRLLIPQGAFGADFRPACRSHDACYDTPGVDRAACDRRYLAAMECACEQSRHPVLCRMVARMMYRVTSRHGEESFRSAQAIAVGTLAAAGE